VVSFGRVAVAHPLALTRPMQHFRQGPFAAAVRKAGGEAVPDDGVYAKFVHFSADDAQGVVNPRRSSVVKYALLAGAIACCGAHPAAAMMSGDALSKPSLGFAEPARPELVGWYIARPAISCNLRIPCPFSRSFGRRRPLGLSYRRQGSDGEQRSAIPYKPCPANVAFPNGRLACLGLP
jgi:hypothetical protein